MIQAGDLDKCSVEFNRSSDSGSAHDTYRACLLSSCGLRRYKSLKPYAYNAPSGFLMNWIYQSRRLPSVRASQAAEQ